VDFRSVIRTKTHPATGDLLLAQPMLPDDHFNRTVVLLCDYSESSGSVGFVLNRKMDLEVHNVVNNFPLTQIPVYYGGPVQTDNLFFVHTLGSLIPNSVAITDKYYWNGDFDKLTELIETGQVDAQHVRFFLGYSGWGSGQLEAEITENSWLIVDSKAVAIFEASTETLWKNLMLQMKDDYRIWANAPHDPILN